MRIALLRGVTSLACLFGAALANPAYASTMFAGVATPIGSGIGANNVVLTVQNTPTESGCVAWNGTADVIGSAACPGGLTPALIGGDEKTGFSQTQTQTVAAAGVLSGQSMAVVLNVAEVSGNLFTVENLSLTIFAPTGAVLFSSGNLIGAGAPPGGGITINSSLQGIGSLGFAFMFDSTQAAAISPFICTSALTPGCSGIANAANANNRIGLGAVLTNVAGGNETFSVADTSSVGIAATTPEPAPSLTFGVGLALLCLSLRFRNVRGRRG